MKRFDHIASQLLLALNIMLAGFLAFETRLQVPPWLQVAGRAHPLVLHFPVAMVTGLGLFLLYKAWRRQPPDPSVHRWITVAAILAAVTAISGLLLSREEGYDTESLWLHKWSGAAIAFALYGLQIGWPLLKRQRKVLFPLGFILLLGITLAGHWGASITHGDSYLTGPVLTEEETPVVLLEDALVFDHLVKPVLKSKCEGCHNDQKAKGDLIMATQALLIKGGKSGALWDLKTPGFGLMMDRIHLPETEKKHMPPKGKPQLSADEMRILEQWLANGASFTQRVNDLPKTDWLFQLASHRFNQVETDQYDFEAAGSSTIEQLALPHLAIQPVAINSPALSVSFYSPAQFTPELLQTLKALQTQVVSLSLYKMPVTDGDLKTIAAFTNLRKLNLSFTQITDSGLAALSSLVHLKQLSLSGTGVTVKGLQQLKSLPELAAIYAWETRVTAGEREKISAALPGKTLWWGFSGDSIRMALNAPIIDHEQQVITSPIPLRLKHYLPGVTIRYTLDGSDPDSLNAMVWKEGVTISQSGLLKAKAFKEGWISSDISEMFFYQRKINPAAISALQPPDNGYKGNGAATLNDKVKSGTNFRNGQWLGFRNNPLDILIELDSAMPVQGITMSSITDIGSYIMPPKRVEVWGGNDRNQLRLLSSIVPEQPSGEAPAYLKAYDLSFARQNLRYLRLVAKPVNPLPSWHRGKGDKGWVFADEIFVY